MADQPVAWVEGPHGAIRANPQHRFEGPQTVNWSIPLYVTPMDCRTCEHYERDGCWSAVECILGSRYERAEFAPLWRTE